MKLQMLLVIVVCACRAADFTQFSELGDLRIMGIVADVPEIDGGSTDDVRVTLTPYISDIEARGRVFVVRVATCLDPGVGQGAEPACLDFQEEVYANDGTFDTRKLADSNYTGAMDAITITIGNPAAQISGYSPQQRHNGVYYLVVFNLVSGDTRFTAVKYIMISEQEDLNINPEISDVIFEGKSLTEVPAKTGGIDVSFTGVEQSYTEMGVDGTIVTRTESYLITWFYTQGKIVPGRVFRGQSAVYVPDGADGDTVVVVVKDQRGGTAVEVISL